MKPQILDYQLFCEHVEYMQAAGEKITVRNILARTGGTTGKVAGYLKQWHTHPAETTANNVVAPEVLQAIMLDKQSGISNAVEMYKTQVMHLESVLQEVSDKCNVQELRMEAKDAEIKDLSSQYVAKLATADAQLSMFKAQALELKQQLKDRDGKLELAVEAKYQAEKHMAVLEAQHANSKYKINEING